MIYHSGMLVISCCAGLLVMATAGTAVGEDRDAVAATEPQSTADNRAKKSKKKSRVLRFAQKDGLDEIVPVAPNCACQTLTIPERA